MQVISIRNCFYQLSYDDSCGSREVGDFTLDENFYLQEAGKISDGGYSLPGSC